MTRPLFDPGLHSWNRTQQQHCRQHHQRHHTVCTSVSGKGAGSYSSSMASMIGHHRPSSGVQPPKKNNIAHERRYSNHCPPVSNSHLLAVHLGEVYPPSTCKDHRGRIFSGLVGAIERHILHSDPSGNVNIPSSRLHIGECPEVPEHLATFALRRSGSLHFRQRRDEATEQQEEKKAFEPRQNALLGRHSVSEPRLSNCVRPPISVETNAACCDLVTLSLTSAGSSGSSLSSAGDTPRSGGLRRTFSWHRIKDKLKR